MARYDIQRTFGGSIGQTLFQSTPADTNANTAVSFSDEPIKIEKVIVSNETGVARNFDLYVSQGAALSAENAVYYNYSLAANSTLVIDLGAYLNVPGEQVGVKAYVISTISFTLYGTKGSIAR